MPVVLIKACCVSSNSLSPGTGSREPALAVSPCCSGGPWAPARRPGLSGRKTSRPQPRHVTAAPSAAASLSALGWGLAWPWLLWALGPCSGPRPQPALAGQGPQGRLCPSAWDPSPPGLQRVEEKQVPRPPAPTGPIPSFLCCWWVRGPQDVRAPRGSTSGALRSGLNALEEYTCVTAIVSVLKLW